MMPEDEGIPPPKDRGIRPVPEEPIPLSEVLERLRASRLPSALDRLDRWRDAGLLGPTVPSGQGNLRLVAPIDVARLDVIAALHHEFDKQKIPDEELAFWLAVAGDRSTPTALVMEAIERCTQRYVGSMMAMLGKRVGGRWPEGAGSHDTRQHVLLHWLFPKAYV
jgi:hypothetical protein